VLRSWVTWSHLRRLRSLERALTRHQVANVCSKVARSVELLAWLKTQDSSLATARQALIDSWLTDSRKDTRGFITWAVRHGYARDLTVPRR
jgi:hypothetical protein